MRIGPITRRGFRRSRAERESNPIYRLLRLGFLRGDRVDLAHDRVTAGASPTFFSPVFFLSLFFSLFFFFFLPASTGFVLPYRRNEQLRANVGASLGRVLAR